MSSDRGDDGSEGEVMIRRDDTKHDESGANTILSVYNCKLINE